MSQETSSRLMLAGLVALFLLTSFMTWKMVGVGQGLQKLIEISEEPVQTISQIVTRADGTSATISTARNTNADGTPESLTSWKTRHDAAVTAFANS